MSLEAEYYHKQIFRKGKFLGLIYVEPGTFMIEEEFFYPTQIRMFVNSINIFSTVQFDLPYNLSGTKYLDAFDPQGVNVNTENKNGVRLYAGQTLHLFQRARWNESRSMLLRMYKE